MRMVSLGSVSLLVSGQLAHDLLKVFDSVDAQVFVWAGERAFFTPVK